MAVRFGLIGCGFISRKHLQALSRCKGAQLVAISDLHEGRMVETKKFFQTISDETHPIKCHKDYRNMLNDPQIDAVIIASFSGLHARMATDALQAQKHVVLEKPMSLSIEEANICEKGTISLEGPTLNQISRFYIVGEQMAEEELNRLLQDENEQIYMYEDFINAVLSKEKHVLIDGTEGKKALEIIFAIYQSELSKQVIHLPLTSFSTTDMCRKVGD